MRIIKTEHYIAIIYECIFQNMITHSVSFFEYYILINNDNSNQLRVYFSLLNALQFLNYI